MVKVYGGNDNKLEVAEGSVIRLRICFFTCRCLTSSGGVENWILRVSKSLAKRHEIYILALNYAEMERLNFNCLIRILSNIGVVYQKFPCIKPPRGVALPNFLFINRLVRLFNSNDIVYVILPNAPIEGLFFVLRKYLKSKLVAGIHGFLRPDILLQTLYLPFFKAFLRAFDGYHVLNKEVYFYLQKMGLNNIYFIPNGVDTRIFQLCHNPSNSQFFNVLFTGRLTEDKGADILVRIIEYFNKKIKIRNVKFIVTGSGPLSDKIRAVAKKYENVNYIGFVNSETLLNVYRSANLFLIPSRTEGVPLRLLEAQSCGLPVVGSKIPGISDIIVNGKTGRLIDVDDVKGFSEAIKDYYKIWHASPGEYYKMNKAIREYIVRNYDFTIVINKLEKMFFKIYLAD